MDGDRWDSRGVSLAIGLHNVTLSRLIATGY
jgi:hypothetical protein